MQNDHLSAEEIAAFLDGAVSSTQRARVEEHLVQCRDCLAEVIDLLRHMPPSEPESPA